MSTVCHYGYDASTAGNSLWLESTCNLNLFQYNIFSMEIYVQDKTHKQVHGGGGMGSSLSKINTCSSKLVREYRRHFANLILTRQAVFHSASLSKWFFKPHCSHFELQAWPVQNEHRWNCLTSNSIVES